MQRGYRPKGVRHGLNSGGDCCFLGLGSGLRSNVNLETEIHWRFCETPVVVMTAVAFLPCSVQCPGFPIVPLYNFGQKSELDGNQESIDALDLMMSTLVNNIDNAELVREQLTFIMTELRKYPETAAKVWDSDMATMVKALRHNYNVVAFAKQATKKKKEAKSAKANELLAAADAIGLFDDLA